jgi:hypothetical protein
MKKILLALIPILFIGCDEKDNITTPTDDRIPFELNFIEYSDNNYFIDKVYADTSTELNMFNLYYGNIPAQVLLKYYVSEIEVFKSINIVDQNSILACAYINLPPRAASTKYSDSLRYNSEIVVGEEEVGRFKLLNNGWDYSFHPETGYITFLSQLHEQDVIAVAYKTQGFSGIEDDTCYGEFLTDLINNSDTVAVLKLVKPRNLQPQFETAWKLKMKNIYKITTATTYIPNLDLDIYLKKSGGTETNTINGMRLLVLFGFDKIKEDGGLGPDGKFDGRIGFNYIPQRAEIIFPVIQPFGGNLPLN